MTLGDRLKKLRKELGLSQEALGAQGFVSTPGWIKIENGQRQASEKLTAVAMQVLQDRGESGSRQTATDKTRRKGPVQVHGIEPARMRWRAGEPVTRKHHPGCLALLCLANCLLASIVY